MHGKKILACHTRCTTLQCALKIKNYWIEYVHKNISKQIFGYPAVVAWSVKALVCHSVNSSPEQAVDRISLVATAYSLLFLNKKETNSLHAEWAA